MNNPWGTSVPEYGPATALDWHDDGLCNELPPDMWFPTLGDTPTAQKAKEVCAACPVRQKCLDYALEKDERHGIWGGLTFRERETHRIAKREGLRTRCKRDHDLTEPANVIVRERPDGLRRVCGVCERERNKARRAAAKDRPKRPRNPPREPLRPIEHRIHELNRAGMSDRLIGEEIGMSETQARHIRRDILGLPVVGKGGRPRKETAA